MDTRLRRNFESGVTAFSHCWKVPCILYRLTDNNCITSYEQKVGKRQTRVYYHLESEGAKRLAEMREEYETAIFVVNFLLDSKEGDCFEEHE